ncbi:DUF4291 domain-containing protein [Amorphoplanes digitatis]|uniref:DUF4291 domain-containing protein n=1 Tax=Actinoplanes digitatis TaxID=1868 RepID=A0A7W7MM34_9ACTN|nr:DUF4291 domain-containing protein [Actinoplanes digitatis]MBB4759503.1 hypothetical protein [Actinoplanes digitatis]BFE67356.1 DUF4291 domain-containing protein [Actinoplanes digitatis]GID94899.1 hypothetical protein Adi01nite_43110 [Actinoplanes digitatis]
MAVPHREIRAVYTDETITVYQAYRPDIAEPAVRAGRFVPPFKRERMTWIKPSFLWMMYRCGWGTKPGQERVLAVEITRAGFEWALAHACLSSYGDGDAENRAEWSLRLRHSPVRVQWDPERSIQLGALPHRSLQLGLGGEAATRYADEWTVAIRDVTELAHRVRSTRDPGLLPPERPYPLTPDLVATIAASATPPVR